MTDDSGATERGAGVSEYSSEVTTGSSEGVAEDESVSGFFVGGVSFFSVIFPQDVIDSTSAARAADNAFLIYELFIILPPLYMSLYSGRLEVTFPLLYTLYTYDNGDIYGMKLHKVSMSDICISNKKAAEMNLPRYISLFCCAVFSPAA